MSVCGGVVLSIAALVLYLSEVGVVYSCFEDICLGESVYSGFGDVSEAGAVYTVFRDVSGGGPFLHQL